MIEWIKRNKEGIIRAAFLVPIHSVATISISHVVSWYDVANPISWAIYLSIAVEIAAMSAIAAASVKVKGFSVWFVFIIVTLIQFIGNIFYSYSEIDVTSKQFKDWSELTAPIFESIGSDLSDVIGQRRWLAVLEGGLLPLISLTCLHFFIKYGEIDNKEKSDSPEVAMITVNEENTEDEQTVDEELEANNETDSMQDAHTEVDSEIEQPTPNKDTPVIKRVTPTISHKMKKIYGKK